MNPSPTKRPSMNESLAPASRAAERSRAAREKAELAMTPAQRLTLALDLSDLCEDLAAAGRHAARKRS